jgi:hypothetical protein
MVRRVEANETWPAVCQSCVITTLAKSLARRLMIGTTCSPSFTARLPPGRKQFCTSMTISADASSGLIGAAHRIDGARIETEVAPRPVRTSLRVNMVHLPVKSQPVKC